MEIKLLQQNFQSAWDQYVLQHSQSEIYHLSAWQQVFHKHGLKTFYVYAQQEKNIVGVLPLVLSKSLLFGNFITSVPFYNYSGILANSANVAQLLYQKAQEIAQQHGAKHIELRHTTPVLPDIESHQQKVRMLLELPESSDMLWDNFKSKLRSQIRRAMKEDMKCVTGGVTLLDDFYRVFAINMRDLGTPVWPKSLFRAVFTYFPENTHICCVYHKDKVVAAGFLLGFRHTLEIPSASSLRKYNSLSPNMLLYWNVLKFACEKNYRFFDFGRSSRDSGPHRFKKQWGAAEVPLNWQYWLADGNLPQLNPQSKKFQMAISMWKKLPVGLANIIGPFISLKLP
ncbi:FemAB family XrtA/PEP-CTERM system-associated protein [Candidatus Uabimicrobium amorphum]|uniref:BioF2-like acetyltransferase domain-containing protein n=1 Tax=Uabimicrobium amorphum TaxID=2596890 RepID=A0A5S9F3V6_UABAM|nr:FemAB family XrtA/PEP-CTERM system-associated protein [Candidatus Uabimicrobium amorphum]BBM85086.1 hypothetical protein UABAM_03449 [Candidatus Uabimicrobium amorphum]